jgi:hypothetical protein
LRRSEVEKLGKESSDLLIFSTSDLLRDLKSEAQKAE